MDIFRLDDKLLAPAYEILCQSLLKPSLRTPFGMSYCVVHVGEKTSPHDHYDGETFLILSGIGKIRILGESRDVTQGDLIVIPNHSEHDLSNTSKDEPLRFVSVFWDQPAYQRALPTEILIYSAPPTPNGKLHLGHLSGPYLAADVARRYFRLRGSSAFYACGVDENQTYVPAKAKQLKREGEPLQVAQEYTAKILEILESFSAKPDSFLTPHSNLEFQNFVAEFFSTLVKNKTLKEVTANYPFCETCQSFIHESGVSGGCPHCGEKTNGNGCEACGLYNDCRDLKDPHCNGCKKAAALKQSTRMVFSLSQYASRLKEALKLKTFDNKMNAYVRRLLDEGLQDVTVTYPYHWGIAAPGFKGQVIYEWFEMAAAYLYEAKAVQGSYEHFWVKSENKTVLAFGFDNSFFYMGLVPALLWAFDPKIKYPDSFVTNFFLLLDGSKFSTSRNHAIWGDDLLKKIRADSLRLYLAKTRAESAEANFTLEEFKSFLQNFGVQKFDHLLQKINSLVSIPKTKKPAEVGAQERYLLETWHALIHQAELSLNLEKFSINHYAQCLFKMIDSLDGFVSSLDASDENHFRTMIAGIKTVAQMILPLCPDLGAQLFSAISVPMKWNTHLDLPGKIEMKPLPLDYFRQQLKGLDS